MDLDGGFQHAPWSAKNSDCFRWVDPLGLRASMSFFYWFMKRRGQPHWRTMLDYIIMTNDTYNNIIYIYIYMYYKQYYIYIHIYIYIYTLYIYIYTQYQTKLDWPPLCFSTEQPLAKEAMHFITSNDDQVLDSNVLWPCCVMNHAVLGGYMFVLWYIILLHILMKTTQHL